MGFRRRQVHDRRPEHGPSTLGAPVTLKWITYRGPGTVKFANDRPPAVKVERPGSSAAFNGKATTTVTFQRSRASIF